MKREERVLYTGFGVDDVEERGNITILMITGSTVSAVSSDKMRMESALTSSNEIAPARVIIPKTASTARLFDSVMACVIVSLPAINDS